MKHLYKYPQTAFPYRDLIETNARRGRGGMEYELLDTGAFDEDRYFDVFVEYAKQTPTDILIQISLYNRGPDTASVHVLPTLWFRNIWEWWPDSPKPSLRAVKTNGGEEAVAVFNAELGDYFLYCERKPPLLFTENETNNQRCFGSPNAGPYVKDGIDDAVVAGRREAVNPHQTGTKAAAHFRLEIGAGQTESVLLRLTNVAPDTIGNPFGPGFRQMMKQRQAVPVLIGCSVARRATPLSFSSWTMF